MNDKFKGLLSGIVATGAYGLMPLFAIPLMSTGMNVGSIMFFRYTIAAIAIALILMYKRTNIRVTPKEFGTMFLLSLLNGGTGFLLVWSYAYLSSGIATVIHFVYPVFVALVMTTVFKERFTIPIGVSIILAITGVLFISGALSSEIQISVKGILISLASVITFGGYIIAVNKSIVKDMPSMKMNLYMMSFLSVILITMTPLFNEFNCVPNNVSSWISILLFGLISTALPSIMLVKTVNYIGSTLTSIVGSCEPIVATIVGVIVFNEVVNIVNVTGMILIIASVVIAMIFKKST